METANAGTRLMALIAWAGFLSILLWLLWRRLRV